MTNKTQRGRTLRAVFGFAILASAAPLAFSALPAVDLKVEVTVDKSTVPAGSDGEAVMVLTPPSGIHINQYPPIRVTLEQAPPITFADTAIKIGLDKMPANPEDNPFKTIDPIRMKFHVAPHASDEKVTVKGKLKYFYCVVKSGYCAPGNKDVTFTVPVTAGP